MPYLWAWSPWHRYSNCGVRRHARKDGKLGIPPQDQDVNPPFIMQLKQLGDQGVDQFEEDYHRIDARLLSDYCRLKREEESLRKALPKPSGEFDQAKIDELLARREYVKHFHVGGPLYWIVLLLISVGEFLLNTVVFQIFGDDQTGTIMMALAVGVVVPWLGHALGGQFRQGFLENGKLSRHTVSIIAILASVLGGLIALSYLREKFFEGAGIDRILKIRFDPTIVALTFVGLNFMLLVGAAIASYLHHNPAALRNRLDERDARQTRRVSGRKIEILERRLAQNTAQLAQVAADRVKLYERKAREIRDWRDHTQRLMSVYHQHNLHTRDDRAMPKCFRSYPPIDVSPLFVSPNPKLLSWECKGVLSDPLVSGGSADLQPEPGTAPVTTAPAEAGPQPTADPAPAIFK